MSTWVQILMIFYESNLNGQLHQHTWTCQDAVQITCLSNDIRQMHQVLAECTIYSSGCAITDIYPVNIALNGIWDRNAIPLKYEYENARNGIESRRQTKLFTAVACPDSVKFLVKTNSVQKLPLFFKLRRCRAMRWKIPRSNRINITPWKYMQFKYDSQFTVRKTLDYEPWLWKWNTVEVAITVPNLNSYLAVWLPHHTNNSRWKLIYYYILWVVFSYLR